MAKPNPESARIEKLDSGRSGGRRENIKERGDLRRRGGGPGQQGSHGTPSRERSRKFGDMNAPSRQEQLDQMTATEKGHRETHASKQQPKESGPGRTSRTRPRGRFDQSS